MIEEKKAQPIRSRVLGMGDYEHADSDSQQRAARRVFLETVKNLKPEVLQTLCTKVLPHYDHLFQRRVSWGDMAMERLAWERDEASAIGARMTLPALHIWAADWFLNTAWVKERALDTLGRWHTYPEAYGGPEDRYDLDRMVRHSWNHEASAYNVPLTDAESTFDMSPIVGYRPDFETRQQAESRIRESIDAYLCTHLDQTEALMVERGWTKKPEKRKPAHFAWLVRYQVDGCSFKALADEEANKPAPEKTTRNKPRKRDAECFTDDAIYRAVDGLARLIGLPLR